jgi:hypothetical protein
MIIRDCHRGSTKLGTSSETCGIVRRAGATGGPVTDGPPKPGGPQFSTTSGGSHQPLTVGKGDQAVILNEAEAAWLTACWLATHEQG